MKRHSIAATLLLLCASAMSQAEEGGTANDTYDGRWSVMLVCTDTQDKSGLVKGYEYTFAVTISGGKLEGQYGAKGAPASVFYSGTVAPDGTLEIKAVGNTGRYDYSVGKVAQGTPYSYTMSGRLDHSRGQAARRELRPCTASFAKL